MDTALPSHIRDFAAVARQRFEQLGGPQGALAAETNERTRVSAGQALADLGAHELAVRTDPDDILAAAVLCQAAGAALLPYPVVAELLSVDGTRLALVDARAARVDHGDVDDRWLLADINGATYTGHLAARTTSKLGPFLVSVDDLQPGGIATVADIALHLILQSWQILGAAQCALTIACEHIKARHQFGRPLADFQSVRFTVADASVAVRGLEELCKFTLSRWRSDEANLHQRSDAIMLKIKASETGVSLMRTCHQLLGALGFCDESDISVIDRHLQPLLRLPLSAEEMAVQLVDELSADRVETLFTEPA